MKTLYLIGGPMGVGKSTACQRLKTGLDRSVFLDGDWCWDMHPFQVNEETQAMVLSNIACLLNSFLHCSVYEHVIFCWVMHRQEIVDGILKALDLRNCRVVHLSLVCSAETLRRRIKADIDAGIRTPDALERSLQYLPLYEAVGGMHLDTTQLDANKVAARLIRLAHEESEEPT